MRPLRRRLLGVAAQACAAPPTGDLKWFSMPVFVLRLKAPRPRFAQTLTRAEQDIMARHGAHWRPYLERGDMVAFGPVLTDEDSYGLAVVETDDEQALRDFAAEDPVVTTGTASFEIGRMADAGTVRPRA
jgi:uncharacterized protein